MKKAMLFVSLSVIFIFTSESLRADVNIHNVFGQNMIVIEKDPLEVL